jgi:hypothetical protein
LEKRILWPIMANEASDRKQAITAWPGGRR